MCTSWKTVRLEAGQATAKAHGDGGPYHILAASSLADERTRVLKHGDTFAVFDHYGDIKAGGLGEEGLYHEDTRYLSCLLLELEGSRPFFLGSTVRDENDQLAVALTNPDLLHEGRVRVPLGTLHIALKKFLWQGVCYQQLQVKNHGLVPVVTSLALHFAADYVDIFEVSGRKRQARGEDLPPEVTDGRVVLGYRGLDGVVRRTILQFSPRPSLLTASTARLDLSLQPQQEATFYLTVGCERQPATARRLAFDDARTEAESDLERYNTWSCHLHTSNGEINAWVSRAVSDLHMMTTALATGPYPYAGLPWFNTPFGRDGIVTALECLWLRPGLARGVLAYLASTQATEVIPEQDAEPGKILHETRNSEMAVLKEVPFGRYYGSVDATPLFVLLAGAYYERTGDRAFVESLWPHLEAGLHWIDVYGDRDGDGFVEYRPAIGQWSTPPGMERLSHRRLPRRRLAGPGPYRPMRGPGLCLCRPPGRRGAGCCPGPGQAGDGAGTAGRGAAATLRAGVLVRGAVHLRPGPGRGQAALPGADFQRRAVPVHRHREPGTGSPRRPDAPWPGVVLRLGRPHRRDARGALQPHGLPQRLGLAS